jgi:hypothetical protein
MYTYVENHDSPRWAPTERRPRHKVPEKYSWSPFVVLMRTKTIMTKTSRRKRGILPIKQVPLSGRVANRYASLGRYVSFARLKSLVETSTLFFARSDKFDDQHEGASTKLMHEAMYSLASRMREEFKEDPPPESLLQGLQRAQEGMRPINEALRTYFAVSCWHIGPYESEAMWKLYGRDKQAICISSSLHRIASSFGKVDADQMTCGPVEYIDYDKQIFDFTNPINALFHKRRAFEYEREFRFVVTRYPKPPLGKWGDETIGTGIAVPVRPQILIDALVLAPDSPRDFEAEIRKLVAAYGLTCGVRRSSLEQQPRF